MSNTLESTCTKPRDIIADELKGIGTSNRSAKASKPSVWKRISGKARKFLLTKDDELGYFAPKTWAFWRGVIMYFFIFSVIGHWMEIPYCTFMDGIFGIVEDDYDVWTDPLFKPYWVYGIGTVAITMILLPMKLHIVKKRKTVWGALLQYFVAAVIISAFLECVIGMIINQPDEFGKHPYWDNSVLPLNIFGQAWLVNDIALGFMSLIYIWIAFPLCQKAMSFAKPKVANGIFIGTLVLFAVICVLSYVPF